MEYIRATFDYLCKVFTWWVIVLPWEQGLRIRFGKTIKLLSAGVHFRIPFFDAIYIQTTRLRIVSLPLQTLTTLDGKTITILASIGYSITDVHKLYNSLYHAESTLSTLALNEISNYISNNNFDNCKPNDIENNIMSIIKENDYGIKFEKLNIIGYAIVKTFRLIQDQHWLPDRIDMTTKT